MKLGADIMLYLKTIDELYQYFDQYWEREEHGKGIKYIAPPSMGEGYFIIYGSVDRCYYFQSNYSLKDKFSFLFPVEEKYIEISKISQDCTDIFYLDQQRMDFEKGISVYINYAVPRGVSEISAGAKIKQEGFVIRASFLEQHKIFLSQEEMSGMYQYYYLRNVASPFLYRFFEDLFYCPITGGNYQQYIDGKALELMSFIKYHFQEQGDEGTSYQELELALALKSELEIFFDQPVSIAALCLKYGINKNKLQRLVKLVTHHTVNEYLSFIRIEQAIRLMHSTDWTMGKIAQSVGYKSPANFYIQFQKIKQCTPREYMRER